MKLARIPSYLLSQILDDIATIRRIADGDDPTDMDVIVSDLRCSVPQVISDIDRERMGMASTFVGLRVYTAVPIVDILERDRFFHDDGDYLIRSVKPWPSRSDPSYLEMLLEDDSTPI